MEENGVFKHWNSSRMLRLDVLNVVSSLSPNEIQGNPLPDSTREAPYGLKCRSPKSLVGTSHKYSFSRVSQ
jgi:hypothetical protein